MVLKTTLHGNWRRSARVRLQHNDIGRTPISIASALNSGKEANDLFSAATSQKGFSHKFGDPKSTDWLSKLPREERYKYYSEQPK